MAIQGAGKPGNQVNQANQGATVGSSLGGLMRLGDKPPDFAAGAQDMIQWMMAAFAPPKVEDKKVEAKNETKAEKTKAKENEDEEKGTTVKATAADSDKSKATDVETEAPAPLNARTAANLSLAADMLNTQVNAQYYGKPEESDFGKNFGANYAGAADTSLHFDKKSEPST